MTGRCCRKQVVRRDDGDGGGNPQDHELLRMLRARAAGPPTWAIAAVGGSARSSVMRQDPLAFTDQGLVSEGTGRTYTSAWPLLGADWRSES